MTPKQLEQLEKAIGEGLKKFGIKDTANQELGGRIGAQLGMAGLWPAGSYATNKVVDSQMEDSSDEAKKAAKIAGGLLFGMPLMYHVLGKDFAEAMKEKEWSDASMSGLSLGIGAAGVAYNNTEFISSSASLGFLFGLAGEIEDFILDKSKEGIEELEDKIKKILPDSATKIINGEETSVELDTLKKGDEIFIKEGEHIPADGKLLGEKSVAALNAFSTSGEDYQIVTKHPGDNIEQGFKAGQDMHLEVKNSTQESTLKGMISDIKDSSNKGERAGKISNIVNKGYVPLMMAAVAGQFGYRFMKDQDKYKTNATEKEQEVKDAIANPDIDDEEVAEIQKNATEYKYEHSTSHSFQHGLERAAQLAIKMAPCAVMAGLLLVPFTRYKLKNEHGIQVNSKAVLEELKDTKRILSDVRGPILSTKSTVEKMTFFDSAGKEVSLSPELAEELLRNKAITQERSSHPLARTLRDHAKEKNIDISPSKNVVYPKTPIDGVVAKFEDGGVTHIGSERFFTDHAEINIPASILEKSKTLPDYMIGHIEHDGQKYWSLTETKGQYHQPAIDTLQKFAKEGGEVTLMTGRNDVQAAYDHAAVTKGLPKEVADRITCKGGLVMEEAEGELTKDQFAEKLLNKNGKGTIFVGDGINDHKVAKEIQKMGGNSLAVSASAEKVTIDASSMTIEGIHQIPDLMELSKSLATSLKINVGLAGAWIAGLVGHHVHASAKDELDKQPSTVTASILHEAPTVGMTLAAGLQTKNVLKILGKTSSLASHL